MPCLLRRFGTAPRCVYADRVYQQAVQSLITCCRRTPRLTGKPSGADSASSRGWRSRRPIARQTYELVPDSLHRLGAGQLRLYSGMSSIGHEAALGFVHVLPVFVPEMHAAMCCSTESGSALQVRAFSFATAGLIAARELHARMLWAVLRAPIAWFDSVPSGAPWRTIILN